MCKHWSEEAQVCLSVQRLSALVLLCWETHALRNGISVVSCLASTELSHPSSYKRLDAWTWSHTPPQPCAARNWHRSWENTHPAATYTYRSTNICAPTYAHIRKNQSLWCALMQCHLQRDLKSANVFLFHILFLSRFIRKVLLQCFPMHLYPSLSNG